MGYYTLQVVFSLKQRGKKKALGDRISKILLLCKKYAVDVRSRNGLVVIEVPNFLYSHIEEVSDFAAGQIRLRLRERDDAQLQSVLTAARASQRLSLSPEDYRKLTVKILKKSDVLRNVTRIASPGDGDYEKIKRILRNISKG